MKIENRVLSPAWYAFFKKSGFTEYVTDGKEATLYLQVKANDGATEIRYFEDQRYPPR